MEINSKISNSLRILGSIFLTLGYILIAGTPFKILGIFIRLTGHLIRLPYSFKHHIKDFILFHSFFSVVELSLLLPLLLD